MALRPTPPPPTLGTLARGKNLVSVLTSALEREIVEGRWRPGDRLPTEASLSAAAGVSRTVVREAVASLKAAGLVETRQGSGAFVMSGVRAALRGSVESSAVEDILAILELRLAVEVEAASLAALRRSETDLAALDVALAELSEARAAGESGIGADLAFHRAMAAATQNGYFSQFLDQLGERAVPRRHLPAAATGPMQMNDYLGLVEAEHRMIRNAVADGDAALAAAAMRGHLAGSRARYAEIRADGNGLEQGGTGVSARIME